MEFIITEITTLLKGNQFLTGGVMLGILASIFYPLKTLPFKIWNKIKFYFTYKIYFDQTDDICDIFTEWFSNNYPNKFRNIEVRFSALKSDKYNSTNYKRGWKLWKYQFVDYNWIWYKNRLIWISKDRKELNAAENLFSLYMNYYTISGFFAKSAIDNLCDELIDLKIKKEGGNIIQTFVTEYNSFRKSNISLIKDFKNIFFKNKEEYINDLNHFINKKELYKEKGINYKRGYLLYGPPGTGKSSIAMATAKYLEYDLYLINLNAIQGDKEFIQLMASVPPRSILLFEDIDCYFKKDERNTRNEKINFSTILNVFDGVYSPNDCITIVTTNKLDELDDALIRKGRADKILNIDYPRIKDIEDFISNFYNKPITLNIKSFNKPMVEVQELCLNNNKNDLINLLENDNIDILVK